MLFAFAELARLRTLHVRNKATKPATIRRIEDTVRPRSTSVGTGG